MADPQTSTSSTTTDVATITPNAALNRTDCPDYQRPEYKAGQFARDLCHDLMKGTQAIRAAGEKYLPKWPAEKPAFYKVRAAISQVARYYERTVKASVGMICATPPKLADDADPVIQSDWEDIDGQGSHGEVFCKDLTTDAINGGFAAILVDVPPIPDGIELGHVDELALGLRPFWVRVPADNILSWIVEVPDWAALVRDYVDGLLTSDQVKAYAKQVVVRQVVLYEPTDVAASTFGIASKERYRVLRLTDAGVEFAVWERRTSQAGSTEGEHFTRVANGSMVGFRRAPLREIPLAIVYAGRRVAPFVADPPLLALAEINLDHYQVSADRRYLMRLCHVPTLFRAGFEDEDDGTGEKKTIEIGPNSVHSARDPQAKMEYVSASPNALQSSQEERAELVKQMATLGMSFLGKDRRGEAETATGRVLDDAAENSTHATVARGLQDGIEQALKFHAIYRGVKAPEAIVNTTYASPQVDPQIAGVIFQAVAADRLPIEVLIEYLQTGVIPEDIDLDSLAEIRLVKAQIDAQAKADAQFENENGDGKQKTDPAADPSADLKTETTEPSDKAA